MLTISDSLTNFIKPYIISPQLVDISRFFIALGLTILVSYFLFKFIESVYFVDKNHKNENSSVQPRQTQNIKKSFSTRNTILGGIVFMLLLFFLYSGNYASSLFVARSTFANSNVKNNTEVLLSDRPTSIFFTSKYSNLSVIVILFRYTNDTGTIDLIKQPRQLVFRLYSQDKKQLIFKSQRDAYQVNGQLRFPFGFTTQIDSKNKKYIAEISIEGVRNEENIYINTSSTSFVTAYTNPRENKIQRIPSFLINRFIFVITNSDAQFALGFLTLVVCLQLYQKNFKNLIVSDSISKSATFRYN